MIPYFVLDQFYLGPVKIYIWGLFVGLGFSAGYLLFYYLARREGVSAEKITGLALAVFLGGILGAKTLAAAQLPGGLFKNINFIFSQHSGAMFMGGLLGAMIFGWGYWKIINSLRFHKEKASSLTPLLLPPLKKGGAGGGLNFWRVADLLVLPTALGIGIGRVACILINEHQGAPTNLPWGILWPDGISRHPVGIYEALAGFGLFVIFWLLFYYPTPTVSPSRWEGESKRGWSLSLSGGVRPDGIIFLLFLLSYSLIRFFLEFTRVASGPLADPRWGVFSVSQWVALLILTLSVFMVLSSDSKKRQS